jgi:plasmid stabilization system protein ParE
MKIQFSQQILKILKYQVRRQTKYARQYITNLTVALRNLANASKKGKNYEMIFQSG